MNTNLHSQILEKFRDKEYRDAFVGEYIFSRVPLKIRAMRDVRDMSQEKLGRLAGIAQPWVSKLEDPTYGRLTISTLLKIASAFDVALYVDFVPFSEILNRSASLSRESFDVCSFADDFALAPVPSADRSISGVLNARGNVLDFEKMKEALTGKGQLSIVELPPIAPQSGGTSRAALSSNAS